MFEKVFAVPGENNIVDGINPETGRSAIEGETLEEIRKRYPGAQVFDFEAWMKAKYERQNSALVWNETTEERYFYMLEVLPPAYWKGEVFAVGEPEDHCAKTGRPRFAAFRKIGEKYLEASRPMTIAELRELK